MKLSFVFIDVVPTSLIRAFEIEIDLRLFCKSEICD